MSIKKCVKMAAVLGAALLTAACSTSPASEERLETAKETEEEGSRAMETGEEDTVPSEGNTLPEASGEKVREFMEEHGSPRELVGFAGHIKEIHGDRALVSSDTDDFPGVFWVLDVTEAASPEDLKEGDPLFILMEDWGTDFEDGIREYKAVEIFGMSEDDRGRVDILLTSAPALGLGDMLSSTMSNFQVQPGSYSWEVDGGRAAVACGAGVLDGTVLKSAARLKVPEYNGMKRVLYGYSTTVLPDKLVIRQWDAADVKDTGAVEESVITYYTVPFYVGLERGKIYEFLGEWKRESLGDRGFCGSASYVFVTE